METIRGGGLPAAAATVRAYGRDDRSGVGVGVLSEAEGMTADNEADDSVEEAGMTEEDEEEDEDAAESKSRADSVSSAGTSATKPGGGKSQSPGKAKRKTPQGESEEDLQESTADEEDEDEDDEAVDDEEEEDDEDDDKASAMDEDEDVDEEEEDVGQVSVSDSTSMLRMVRSLPEEEARRHELFRRSHFERGAVKRCMAQAILEASGGDRKAPSVTNVMAIVMAGMTKVFVGEITAEARRIMEKSGETGPIRPRHLREAHRRYYRRHPLARGRNLRRLFH